MKPILYFYTLCFVCAVSAQETLQPELMSYPDISAEALAKHEAIATKYSDLEVRLEDGGKALTEAEKKFMAENEMTAIQGPFTTANIGCDWYCAGGVYRTEASTELKPSKTTNYKSTNAHDWDLRTAWATNVNDGINEKLCYYFKSENPLSVTHLEIYNGYQKSETTWKNNSRAKKIAVSINGKYLYDLELQDTYKMQKFAIGEHFYGEKEMQIELKTLAVYKGEKYNDLCISEVNIDGAHDH